MSDHEKMYIQQENIASDNATFFADHLDQGCQLCLKPGKIFLCRQNPKTQQWENALIYKMTNFPHQEVIDDIHASLQTILWIEPEHWQPLGYEPNDKQSEIDQGRGIETMFQIFLHQARGPQNKDQQTHKQAQQWYNNLKTQCKNKTHRQVLNGE